MARKPSFSSGGAPPPASWGSGAPAPVEERLRAVEMEIAEKIRARRRAGRFSVHSSTSSSSSVAPPSPPGRFWRGAREAAKKVLGIDHKGPARTGGADDDACRSEQQPAECPARSDYAAMMRTALAKFGDGAVAAAAADNDEAAAASAVMEQAMTGLMGLTYRKMEPPELPHEFATRWPVADDGTLQAGTMHDPVILASGYSIDQSYQRRFFPQQNTCPVTNYSLPHSLSVPNHLLRDMIAAWCLDHSNLSPPTTTDTPSISSQPSEEQIQDILEKLSGSSASQQEALHLIQQLSKATKGVQPSLIKYPDLITVLLDLKKKWKSVWTQDTEEERLMIILNLTMHWQNRAILAGQSELPGALKKVAQKAIKLGSPASSLGKVASIVAILSEYDMFRKRMLDTGGMKMLRDMLKIEDTVVRMEAATAILALCTDDEGKLSAEVYDVTEMLLECHMLNDQFLLLLDCLPKGPHALDKICDQALELVNIVMGEHTGGPVTSQGIHSAISLICIVVERDVGKMKMVNNLEGFKQRLQQLLSDRIPMQTMFQVENITRTLSDMFPAPMVRGQNQEPGGNCLHSHE